MLEEEQVISETNNESLVEDFQFFSSGEKGTIAYRTCGGLTLPSAYAPSVNKGLNSPIKCSSWNFGLVSSICDIRQEETNCTKHLLNSRRNQQFQL